MRCSSAAAWRRSTPSLHRICMCSWGSIRWHGRLHMCVRSASERPQRELHMSLARCSEEKNASARRGVWQRERPTLAVTMSPGLGVLFCRPRLTTSIVGLCARSARKRSRFASVRIHSLLKNSSCICGGTRRALPGHPCANSRFRHLQQLGTLACTFAAGRGKGGTADDCRAYDAGSDGGRHPVASLGARRNALHCPHQRGADVLAVRVRPRARDRLGLRERDWMLSSEIHLRARRAGTPEGCQAPLRSIKHVAQWPPALSIWPLGVRASHKKRNPSSHSGSDKHFCSTRAAPARHAWRVVSKGRPTAAQRTSPGHTTAAAIHRLDLKSDCCKSRQLSRSVSKSARGM